MKKNNPWEKPVYKGIVIRWWILVKMRLTKSKAPSNQCGMTPWRLQSKQTRLPKPTEIGKAFDADWMVCANLRLTGWTDMRLRFNTYTMVW